MKCVEAELLIAESEITAELEEHLAGCAGCRALSNELEANRHAMRALGEELMPALTIPNRSAGWWKLSSAAAALVLTAAGAWWASRPPKPPHIVSVDVHVTGIVPKEAPVVRAPIPERLTPAIPIVPAVYTEPLRVKMLTPDPDVVIYWLIDQKGELE